MKKTLRLLCCICAFSLIESAPLKAWDSPWTWAKKKWNNRKQKQALKKAYKKRDADAVQRIIAKEKNPKRKEELQRTFDENKRLGVFEGGAQKAHNAAIADNAANTREVIDKMPEGDRKAEVVASYKKTYGVHSPPPASRNVGSYASGTGDSDLQKRFDKALKEYRKDDAAKLIDQMTDMEQQSQAMRRFRNQYE
ncbi:MAG: hypothetical protein V6Z78_03245 [Holosporaceae bacterium]